MLVIDERHTVERLADLEDLAVALRAHGRRIEAQHQVQRQAAASRRMTRHPHPPVRRFDLRFTSGAALCVEHEEERAVLHELPAVDRLIVMHARMGIAGAWSARAGEVIVSSASAATHARAPISPTRHS